MTTTTSSTWWQKLLLILGSLAVCFVALELAIRILEPARVQDGATDTPWDEHGNSLLHVRSDNPRLVYELRPSASVYVDKFERTFTTNAAGFRDREYPRAKPDGVYRIAAIGDSVTFGWDQALDETYPKLLEAGLAAAGMANVEVLNFGIGGYNSLQEIELIRARALAFEPDLLLLAYVMNDNTVQGADGGLARHFNRTSCRACDFVKLRVTQLYRRFGVSPTEAALRELGALSAAHEIPVVVVVFPLLEVAQDGGYPAAAIHDLVHELSQTQGFPVLDLLDPFRAAGFETIKQDAIHPNAAGHAIAADRILEFLNEHRRDIGLPMPVEAP